MLLKASLGHPVGNVDRYNPSGKDQAVLGRIHGTDKQKDRHSTLRLMDSTGKKAI